MGLRAVLMAAGPRDPFVSQLVRLLRSEGREVLVTHRVGTTLATARSKRPDLIVLDTALPDGDGFSLCRRLKQDPATAGIPVYCYGVVMARDRCVEAGADDFMLKPLEQDALLEKIRSILDNRLTRLQARTR